ncbi:MAG: nucleotidyl transferase AbiEii/AbiGii toxin family protein [Akkermansiaceae bacterium]|nr:nucleotidyl transferase AbiEii/AbiGii toxin family protein [Akkermansiaceae bacterium]
MNPAYLNSVRLLLAVAPSVFRQPVFALKGGTAINMFLRDMPRLSVDLDLVFTDHHTGRDVALQAISDALEGIRDDIQGLGFQCELGVASGGGDVKLFVQRDRTRIKLEVNHVFRGTVLPIHDKALVEPAREAFLTDLRIPVLHPDELYGSKLVAAMDRQHPRDLFDVLGLYESDGLTPGTVECFVSYIAGHNRPVHEVLFANQIDMRPAFANEFEGMTRDTVPLDALLATRSRLMDELPKALTEDHRNFLFGLVRGQPDWSLMQCPHLEHLPAIRWKLENLAKLKRTNPAKFNQQAHELEERLQA